MNNMEVFCFKTGLCFSSANLHANQISAQALEPSGDKKRVENQLLCHSYPQAFCDSQVGQVKSAFVMNYVKNSGALPIF